MHSRLFIGRFASGPFSSCVMRPLLSALLIFGYTSFANAAPEGGTVRAGTAQIIEDGSRTLIQQGSDRAIIDWRSFSIGSQEQVQFVQPSSSSATLNRVTGGEVSLILGRLDANGQVLLINPQGIIFGRGAQVNVGSLIASTANLSDDNFLKGRLVFDQPGSPGAAVVNAGTITAAEGGLVALVAPRVGNDGLIQARLGRVMMGSADTFTIDLYGDGLINLALSDESLAWIGDSRGHALGSLVSQAGTIDVGSGRAVLVTAEVARGVMDSLINMSGTILADSAVQEGGRIHLLARGGAVDVSGELSARGTLGGTIEVLGDQVRLSSTARLSADGSYGGGTVHVGGAFQGGGDTYRSQATTVDAGAAISASAPESGDGGEVILWSDGHTDYAGSIEARGGLLGGDGGLVEVSGKETLAFGGFVDASAPRGSSGSLLLDPYDFTIGMSEASLINRVLRTGTSTSVSADNNIYVNYVIDGRGRYAGGGLTLSAGNSINVNDYIITNNGAINLYAGRGTVSLAPGTVVYAGTAPITVRSGADLYNAPYLTGGLLWLISSGGSVYISQAIESALGSLFISAADDVDINEPIVSISTGGSVNVTAGRDITIGAQVDGRPSAGVNPLGSVTMTAGRDIHLKNSIIANSINLAGMGTISAPTMTAGTVTLDGNGIPQGDGLFSGTGPISVTAGGDLFSGIYVTYGPVALRSTGGDVYLHTKIAEILGNVTIAADIGSVHVDQEIANIRSGSNLAIMAGQDINLNRQIDALDDTNLLSIPPVQGGSVTFVAGHDVILKNDLITYDGPVNITATNGTLKIAWKDISGDNDKRTYGIQSGAAPITVKTWGDLSTGPVDDSGKPIPISFDAPDLPDLPSLLDLSGLTGDELRDAKGENIATLGTWYGQIEELLQPHVLSEPKRWIAFSTAGELGLESMGGSVLIDAPIPHATGEITIKAAEDIVVNQKVYSNDQDITLTSTIGGIKINSTTDDYGIPAQVRDAVNALLGQNNIDYYEVQKISIPYSPSIDSGKGNLTLDAGGNFSMFSVPTGDGLVVITNGIATQGELTIKAGGKIEPGKVNQKYSPSKVTLIAGTGIGELIRLVGSYAQYFPFDVGYSSEISATSVTGDVFLSVDNPGLLYIEATEGNVYMGVFLGTDTTIRAGTDILLNTVDLSSFEPGSISLTAARNVILNRLLNIKGLEVNAGGSVNFHAPNPSDPSIPSLWFDGGGINVRAGYQIDKDNNWNLNELMPTPAGGDIIFNDDSAVHVGNPEGSYDHGLTLKAHGDITLQVLQTYGPVSIESTKENAEIYLNNPIGPEYETETEFTPYNKGVASFSLTAPDSAIIEMTGVRSEGPVTIFTGGTLYSSRSITYKSGNTYVPIQIPANANWTIKNVYIGTQPTLLKPGAVSPLYAPGPMIGPPGPPMALTALPAQPPGLANVSGSGIPGASGGDESFSESEVESVEVGGSFILTEIIPEEDEDDEDEEKRKKTLRFSGGRGDAWSANLGRR